MSFAPGDEVCCIDDSFNMSQGYGDEMLPVRGQHYTVRDAAVHEDGVPVIRLVEIFNKARSYTNSSNRHVVEEPCFLARRFRPVRREAVEQFKRMAAGTYRIQVADHTGSSAATLGSAEPLDAVCPFRPRAVSIRGGA